MSKTLNCIQVARGLAAFMVVSFHMLPIESKYVGLKILPSAFWVGQIGVDIFFVISGFVMMISTENLIASRETSLEFLRRRLVRIYPIYWFFALLVLPVYLVSPHLVNASQGNQVDLLRSFLLLPSQSLPIIAVAWSLVFELWFYLLFAVLLMFPRQYRPALLAIWAGALTVSWFGAPANFGPTLTLLTSPYALEFIAGCAGYYLYRVQSIGSAKLSIMVGATVFVLTLWARPSIVESVTLYRSLFIGCSASLVLAGFAVLEKAGQLGRVSEFAWTGDISYVVYLSHVLVLSVIGRVFAFMTNGAKIPLAAVIGFWLVAIILVVGVGVFTHQLIERPLGRFLKPRYSAAVV